MSQERPDSGFRRKARERNRVARIVLPDALDARTLAAARNVRDEGIAEPILVGVAGEVRRAAETHGENIDGIEIRDLAAAEEWEPHAADLARLRESRGVDLTRARELLRNPLYAAGMMVRRGEAEGSVAGSLSATGDVIRAGIHTVGLADGIETVSSCFLMLFPDRAYAFADGAVVPDPTPEQLADIGLSTAETFRRLTGLDPVIAFLSFSTHGSAEHPMVERVQQATAIAREKAPKSVRLDGELQLDAAIVPAVAERKAPESPIGGMANVLIFPDLNSGNIGYKMAQRMGGAAAIGPLVQGMAAPIHDLSRGCSVEDIIDVVAIAAIEASDE